MSVLPLNWPDKVDSPELLAWLQQSGIEKYIDAAQINSIRDALNELHSRTADTRIVENTGYEIVGTDVVINQLWKWLIISILYSNDSEITLPITLSSSGKQKICFLCANQNNGFELVYGPESDTNPAAPTIGNDLLYITFFVVTDGIISQPEAPISGSLFKRKYESQKFVYNLSGTNQVIQLRSAGHSHYEIQGTVSSISGFGKAQLNQPSSEQPYAGKDIYIENKTGQDLTLKNAMSGVDISFEFSGDLIIPDNGFVWLKVNFFGNKLVFIMKSWDDPVDLSSKADLVAGKVPVTQLPSYVDDVLEFANLAAFPTTGETGKIYVALDTNFTYRWSGSVYVQIGTFNKEVEQQLQRYWYSIMANTLNTTLLQVNNTNSFTVAGTASVVSRSSTTYYNSIAMNNYLSATANGSNCGVKNNNQGDGSYLEGFDSSFVFINNDTNSGCETTVGYYALLSAIPNIAKINYTTDLTCVGNDVGDTNLSFYCKRNTETPSYVKVDCGSAFPAHTTTDAYFFRMQMSRGYHGGVGNTRTLKMTIINIITGAIFSHTFTDTQIPASSRNIVMVVNRSNRNTGVATNIRFSKFHQTKYIY